MHPDSVLFNPPIPGVVKRRGRPKGSGDKRKRKTPERGHLTKVNIAKQLMDDQRKAAAARRRMMEDEDKEMDEEKARLAKEAEEEQESDDDTDQVPTVEQERDKVPDIDWPATVVMIGKKFAGKTTALLRYVDPKQFDNVFIVTKTKHRHNFDSFGLDEDHILDGMSEEFIELLVEHQKETEAKTLLIFDDFIGMEWEPVHSKKLKLLAASGRNFELSMIFSSQDLVQVPTIVRRNAEYLLIGNNYETTIDALAKQLALPGMGRKQFRLLLEKISKRKDHELLFIDDRNQDWWVWKPEHVPELDHNKPKDPKFDPTKKHKRDSEADEISMGIAADDAKGKVRKLN